MLQMDIVDSIMKDCGWNHALRGTTYTRDAVQLYDPNERSIGELYQAVAAKRNTTASRVERAIRHAAENVFYNADVDDLRTWFGGGIDRNSGKMANSALIAALWFNAGGGDD